MTQLDPYRQWDGYQWLRWDGQQWRPERESIMPAAPAPVAYQPAYGGQPSYVTDKTGHNVQAIIAWVFTVLTLGYLLPWAIAATRGKANAGAIGLLNFFLGWSIIGWIAAMVMACGAHQIGAGPVNIAVMQAVAYPTGYPPAARPQPYPPPPSQSGVHPTVTGAPVARYEPPPPYR